MVYKRMFGFLLFSTKRGLFYKNIMKETGIFINLIKLVILGILGILGPVFTREFLFRSFTHSNTNLHTI